MSTGEQGRGRDWAIQHIPVDEDGARFTLDKLKPFRLAALQHDPDAFGSDYAREVAFTDEVWLSRLHNPLAKTFVAVSPTTADPRGEQGIVASTTVFGPLPSTAEDLHFMEQSGLSAPWSLPVYHVTGVYTNPESRGRGIAKAVMGAALEDLQATLQRADAGHEAGKPAAVIRVDVYAHNMAAHGLYSAAGFSEVESRNEARESSEPGRRILSMFRLLLA
ncbi:uncharacterized protein B0I36DRAFT_324262 [Microdochium trichocladiopsis]|uniref:N-acetyltransferase domain-containing protein n=1 Tax=Microdochium trichocladiopsis TaxID=1682393 RepID=A0A9P8Y5J1_9PEZI|nr:uncharacterized protein B0I36DRAFT_324262 [Microdochium trichocladiopsis]KAH7031597.1 hypothetical protein B0I36DRAFT_324262 [Microdochium trichocladiopsis]